MDSKTESNTDYNTEYNTECKPGEWLERVVRPTTTYDLYLEELKNTDTTTQSRYEEISYKPNENKNLNETSNIPNESIHEIEDDNIVVFSVDSDSDLDRALDLSIPVIRRMKYFTTLNESTQQEVVNKLYIMLCINDTISIHEYLRHIVKCEHVSIVVRTKLLMDLFGYSHKNDDLFTVVLNDTNITKLGLTILCALFDMILTDQTNKINVDLARTHIRSMLRNSAYSVDTRYKKLKQYERLFETDELKQVYIYFSNMNTNYLILASQRLITFGMEEYSKKLLEITEDGLKPDAYDVVYRLSKIDEYRDHALQGLMKIGKGVSIYDSSQNVHFDSIDKSMLDSLKKLQLVKTYNEMTYAECKELIRKHIIVNEDTFSRIEVDSIKYNNMSVENILVKIISYIMISNHRDELWKRLSDEFKDMKDTCSSGIATRLINTLTGFGDMGLQIDYGDEILANFTAKVNKRILNMDDEKQRDRILEEITHKDKYNRPYFQQLICKELPYIKEELRTEYSKYMDDSTFDIYMFRAITKYDS
jgi:hypothetical protein